MHFVRLPEMHWQDCFGFCCQLLQRALYGGTKIVTSIFLLHHTRRSVAIGSRDQNKFCQSISSSLTECISLCLLPRVLWVSHRLQTVSDFRSSYPKKAHHEVSPGYQFLYLKCRINELDVPQVRQLFTVKTVYINELASQNVFNVYIFSFCILLQKPSLFVSRINFVAHYAIFWNLQSSFPTHFDFEVAFGDPYGSPIHRKGRYTYDKIRNHCATVRITLILKYNINGMYIKHNIFCII